MHRNAGRKSRREEKTGQTKAKMDRRLVKHNSGGVFMFSEGQTAVEKVGARSDLRPSAMRTETSKQAIQRTFTRAANALLRVNVKHKCFQSISEVAQRYVDLSRADRMTSHFRQQDREARKLRSSLRLVVSSFFKDLCH